MKPVEFFTVKINKSIILLHVVYFVAKQQENKPIADAENAVGRG